MISGAIRVGLTIGILYLTSTPTHGMEMKTRDWPKYKEERDNY